MVFLLCSKNLITEGCWNAKVPEDCGVQVAFCHTDSVAVSDNVAGRNRKLCALTDFLSSTEFPSFQNSIDQNNCCIRNRCNKAGRPEQ